MKNAPRALPQSIEETLALLTSADYVADRALATVLFLSLRMRRPLFLEGEAGVGKTEIAKVLASALGRQLIRLQCYEGLDVSSAVYEWNYAAQMIEIRMEEAEGKVDRKDMEKNVFSEKYLIRRPVLEALNGRKGAAPVFLIDELDRTDAVRELEIVRRKVPDANSRLSVEIVRFIQKLREIELFKAPGVAETIDWAGALTELDKVALDPETVSDTIGVILKYQDDIARIEQGEGRRILKEVKAELPAAQ